MAQSVLVDANVWVSRTLSDWVFSFYRAGVTPMFEIQWTEDIQAEARYRLRRINPESASRALDFRFNHIREALRHQRIDRYDIVDRTHPDPFDWHVVNAAIQGQSDYLVTDDKIFQQLGNNDDLPFEVHTADSFLVLVAASSPKHLRAAVRDQWDYHCKQHEKRGFNLPKSLFQAGAPEFADIVRLELQTFTD